MSPTMRLGCVYTTHPLSTTIGTAVPRLKSELLERLAAAHPDWELSAASPEAVELRGIRTVSLGPKARPGPVRKLQKRVTGRAKKPYPFSAKIKAYADSLGPDSTILSMRTTDVLALRRAGYRGKIVFWLGNHPYFSGPLGPLANTIPHCDLVIFPVAALAEDTFRLLQFRGFETPSLVIPHAQDPDRFFPPSPDDRAAARKTFGISNDALVLAHAGAHWPLKGRQIVEAAMRLLPAGGRDVVLLSAGYVDPARHELAPGRHVVLPGGQDRDGMVRVYHAADIGIACSLVHEFPSASIEMMASALPVIASNLGGLPEHVGRGGLLVDRPSDPELWAEAIEQLRSEEDLRATMSNSARAKAVKIHSPDEQVRRWTRAIGLL